MSMLNDDILVSVSLEDTCVIFKLIATTARHTMRADTCDEYALDAAIPIEVAIAPKLDALPPPRITKRVQIKNRQKKLYVLRTTVSAEQGLEGEIISVKLEIHHNHKELLEVKFQYARTENIQSVVREMVATLGLDQSRKREIVSKIKMELRTLRFKKCVRLKAEGTLPQPPLNTCIRRIYLILTIQLWITCGVIFVCIQCTPLNAFMAQNSTCIGIISCFLIALSPIIMCCTMDMEVRLMALMVPYIALLLGVIVSCCLMRYSAMVNNDIVLQTASITVPVFSVLTMFTFQTQIDCTVMRGYFMMTTIALCVWSLIVCVMGWQTSFLFSLVNVILFGWCILSETNSLMDDVEFIANCSLTGDVPSWRESFLRGSGLCLFGVIKYWFILGVYFLLKFIITLKERMTN
eukprot:413423_1